MKNPFFLFFLASLLLHVGGISFLLLLLSNGAPLIFTPIEVTATSAKTNPARTVKHKAAPVAGGQTLTPQSNHESSSIYSDYLLQIRENMIAQVTYPLTFQRNNISGKLQVAVTIGPSGQIIQIEAIASSGNADLDAHGLNCIKNAAPFAPPPGEQVISIIIPIEFKKPNSPL
ncbi:MAG: TonB family protein [Bdellovibrionota bacterium]